MTAIPFFPDTAPCTQIPTQYSVHKCSKLGDIIDHSGYLADPTEDWRRDLADNLINDLNGEESIICYSNFEKNIINYLKNTYPELSSQLDSLISRLVDLEAIIRNNYCHYDFHGSTSIKATLPALVPEMSYDEIEISDGDTASATFTFMIQGKYENGEIEKKRNDLLEYCKQDTLAMIKLHERLIQIIN